MTDDLDTTGASRLTYIASVSGGKDSTAMVLRLRELGIPFRAVFYDTGWEHEDTYRYVREVLPAVLGQPVEERRRLPVLDDRREAMAAELEESLGFTSAMVRWCLKKAMFPSRVRRWCTHELKHLTARDVIREAHARGELPVNVVGVRAEESPKRAGLPERELDPDLDCMVWRPLIAWTEAQVIEMHQRHGIRPNPLYLREEGAKRVGCWPCIQCGKAELRLLSRDEKRVRILERLEEMVALLARERASERGEVLTRPPAFFQGNRSDRGDDGQIPTIPIRQRLEWAWTARGGDQMLLDLPEDSGCMRWGMCGCAIDGAE